MMYFPNSFFPERAFGEMVFSYSRPSEEIPNGIKYKYKEFLEITKKYYFKRQMESLGLGTLIRQNLPHFFQEVTTFFKMNQVTWYEKII